MPLKQAAWIHGNSALFEEHSWEGIAERKGSGVRVKPSNEKLSGWVHFAIPTPAAIDGPHLTPHTALIRFTTGPLASIIAIHAHEAEMQRLKLNEPSLQSSTPSTVRRDFPPNTPAVAWGVSVDIQVKFSGKVDDAWIDFHSAGVDFWL